MAHYRVEAWFQPLEETSHDEDYFEGMIRDLFTQAGLTCQGGPVVFQIYPGGT